MPVRPSSGREGPSGRINKITARRVEEDSCALAPGGSSPERPVEASCRPGALGAIRTSRRSLRSILIEVSIQRVAHSSVGPTPRTGSCKWRCDAGVSPCLIVTRVRAVAEREDEEPTEDDLMQIEA
jgi:hypothetical protein